MIDRFIGLLSDFFGQPTWSIVGQFYAVFGWLALFTLAFFAFVVLWLEYRQGKYKSDWKHVLLAIDIPLLNVQTPKAVEQLFSHIAGALDSPNIKEKFWDGYKQRWFSFEIISIEGYIQFLVWTEQIFVDLVQASVYAQYPDAEITEVEDYVGAAPDIYPNPTHEIWIGDFGLQEDNAFPLRSYREFEHAISKDTVLKDPMGTLLESFTRIGPGEQMWLQILLEPIGNGWKEKSIKKIKELIGAKDASKKSSLLDSITDNFLTKELSKSFQELNSQLTGALPGEASETKNDKEEPNLIRYLTPGQSKLVEAMEEKISKIGFKTKVRGVYIAPKKLYNPHRGVNALVGAINQFNIPSANSLVPIKTAYDSKPSHQRRRKKLMNAYKKRKINTGGPPSILNIEELATIWHFPMSHVKTPLVQKAATKTAEPPSGLPVESLLISSADLDSNAEIEKKEKPKYTTDSGDPLFEEDLF
ncbi:MAG: hypothetical protein HYY51_00115 [Candidatus Magasanikbacteria bacterium]|nr:hypothetical protein [Candidatus Magasanikbacteria bacterium]